MPKQESLRTQVALTNSKLDNLSQNVVHLTSTMETHDRESQRYREKTVRNEEKLKWIKPSVLGLYGLAGSVLIALVWILLG